MGLAEIQEAIEKLAPEERAALREWLDAAQQSRNLAAYSGH
jgi:uncharacterized membrane protein